MIYLVRYPRTFAAMLFLLGVIRSVWLLYNPDPSDHQAVLDSRYQPLAVLVGGALPWTIAAIAVYFGLRALAKRTPPEALKIAPARAAPQAKAPAPVYPPEVERALDAIDKLGQLMELYPSAILDESALPVPKPRMKVLLRVAVAAFRDDLQRIEILRTAWLMLGSFQPGIGPTPLVPPTLSNGRPTPEMMVAFERYHALSAAATDEGSLNVREADLYLKSLES